MQKMDEVTAKKILAYFGLGTKARLIASGEFSTEKAVKAGMACLVIVAEDASDNTKKMFRNMCTFYKVPIYFFGEKAQLGHAMGKQIRSSLALLDQGLAGAIEKQLKNGGSEYGENENI